MDEDRKKINEPDGLVFSQILGGMNQKDELVELA
jgi:hypothetical protein